MEKLKVQLLDINDAIFLLFKPIYDLNDVVAGILHTTPDNSMYLLMLVLTFILAFVYKLLPAKTSSFWRYLFNGFFGFLILFIQFKWTILHVIVTSFVSYLLVRFLPAKWSTGLTFVGMFIYTSLFQIFELVNYYLIKRRSIRSVLMLELFRVTTVPFNLLDGQRKLKENKNDEENDEKKTYQDEVAISKCPGVLQYFSYVFNFTTLIAGPIVDYKHYENFVTRRKVPQKTHWKQGLKRVGLAFSVFALYNVLNMLKINANLIKRENLIDENSWIQILVYTYVAMFFFRLKYYFAWGFAEAICIFLGLGYSPEDKSNKFEHVSTYHLSIVESSTSVRTMITSWNVSVSKFFRYYVYDRVSWRSRTLKSTLVMILSAFWHGFYPGYYLSWTFIIFLNQIYIDIYKKWKPLFLVQTGYSQCKSVVQIFVRFCMGVICMMSVSYFFVPFLLLSWEEVSFYYGKFYWAFHWVLVIVFVVMKWLK